MSETPKFPLCDKTGFTEQLVARLVWDLSDREMERIREIAEEALQKLQAQIDALERDLEEGMPLRGDIDGRD